MEPSPPLGVECPGCSCRIELSVQESGLLARQDVTCPECGQSVPVPTADGRPHLDAGPEEVPAVGELVTNSSVSTARPAGRSRQKSSQLGVVVAAVLGGVTILGAFTLFPGFFQGAAEFLLAPFVNDVDANAPDDPKLDGPRIANEKSVVAPPPAGEPAPAVEPPPITKPEPPSPEESAKRAGAQLRLAKILLKKGRKADAKRRFEKLIEEYPGTEAAEEARKLLIGL